MEGQAPRSETLSPNQQLTSTESDEKIVKSISKLPLRGIRLTSSNEKGLIKPRGTLANISVQEVQTSLHQNFRSETRTFFDKQSEDIFLSLCALGHNNVPTENSSEVSRSEEAWKGTQYISKVKHTWYLERWFETQSGTHLELSREAVESLQSISSKLSSSNQEDIKGDIFTFFSEFGSHVSLGPFVIGGRSVEKVSFSDCKDLDKKEIWNHLETEFNNMNPQDVDMCSVGGDALLVTIKSPNKDDEIVEFTRQLQVFGGNEEASDFRKWKEDLPSSSLVISGNISLENVRAVWDISSQYEDIFGKSCESLSRLLKETWSHENIKFDSSHLKNTGAAQSSEDTEAESGEKQDQHEETSDEDTRKGKDKEGISVPEILQKLHLSRQTYSLSAANVLRKDVLEEGEDNKDVMWKFLRSISSFDYRGRKCFKVQPHHLVKDTYLPTDTDIDIFTKMKVKKKGALSQNSAISSMDVTFAILHCCDPFLRQELLWKMVECRLAVPILLPSLDEKGSVEFQLWGLRKVYKTWKSRVTNETPLDRSVVSHPLPIVSFLRFGNITFSKSKLLNKIMGKLQGNNDHSFFVDIEEESPCATHSKGTVEVAWFLPEGMSDLKDPNALLDAVTFFNLRGDAIDYPVQKQFVCRASNTVVALVEEERYSDYAQEISNISKKMTSHLVCIIFSKDLQMEDEIVRQGNVTIIRSKKFVTDFGENVCQELNQILWRSQQEGSKQIQFRSIESLTDLCNQLKIRIDENNEKGVKGKTLAQKVKERILQAPGTYKERHLPLQQKLWKEWAALDKKWNKGYCQEDFTTIEHYQDHLKREMLKIREEQRNTPPTEDIVDIVTGFKLPEKPRQYFVAWLNLYLNDLSQRELEPLRRELRDIQNKAREINAEKSKLKDISDMSSEEMVRLQELQGEDESLLKRTQEITNALDSGCLGMEHYLRELGQHYEAYEDLEKEAGTDADARINVQTLPDIAAELLIDGHPLEILDGEVGRVPIKWVQAVFKAVIAKLGDDVTVSAVSVLGVQSSGKSTLLNSMFGVRFAVSAGRCTRGVFIQLLKVDEGLVKDTGYDYVIVIDTEGLKAPERSFRNDFRYDNELATFALCLADLTVINIAGQTIGKDMTDVLQIAAHAFIRMKEVHIKSSCRIIQQFVADLAAVDKNETCTQAILKSLDEAISAAAAEEGYGNLYTRFSDVFNLKRNEEVQYIPSLWQGSMAPPNHRYSEKIMQLRKVIVEDLGQSKRTFKQFAERTTNVWNALKEENFIFNFQSCVIALRYKTFQHVYGKWIGEMRHVIMERESSAKQRLRNVPKDQLGETKIKLRNEISIAVQDECKRIKEQIRKYLEENVTDDEDQLLKFKYEFFNDLVLTQKKFTQDTQETLDRIANSITQLNQIDVLLPKCKNELREKARTQAVELRKKNAKATTIDTVSTKEELDSHFEQLWEDWIKDICKNYPPLQVTKDDIEMEFDSYLIRQGEKNDIFIGLKRKLDVPRITAYKKATTFLSKQVSESQKRVVNVIIENALATLQIELGDDRAFDQSLIQKLVDTTIYALNNKHENTTLTHEIKINVIIQVCERAIPIILEGRTAYNTKYSLRDLLMKEKKNLKKDFRALCSSAFQDKRASESLTSLLNEKILDMMQNYLGPAIYKAVRESCPYFDSKFAMFGYVLEDMAIKEEFEAYSSFIFDLREFLEKWSLGKIAEICVKESYPGKSFLEKTVTDKVEDICHMLLRAVSWPGSKVTNTDHAGGESDSVLKLNTWIKQLCQELNSTLPQLSLSDEDTNNLLLFDVEDVNFFVNSVKQYIEQQMTQDIVKELCLPGVGCIKEAEKLLQGLPRKLHEEITEHVSGCTEQCPICHAPCDNMTKQHEKHRAELHYPEGLVGCAQRGSETLVYTICTSSITTNLEYEEGKVTRIYSEFHKDFPNWVIQPIQNDSPLNYWKWVMNRFNEDFAKLYGRREARLPEGWVLITKEQAIEDLREAYVTRQINDS